MEQGFAFKRLHLAQACCDSLIGRGIADATSGLFLAGPRRVGKTTFLIEDLIPAMENRTWVPVYVDLWANKLADPALLIIEAIKAKIDVYRSKLKKLAGRIQLKKVNLLKTLEFDFSIPGLPDNLTIADLLDNLIQLADKPVALIIDEAQHALTTSNGLNTMFAIKSARDQINHQYQIASLMLVFTGSNRDKLAQLVIKKDQPFFGANITPFPLLGRDYTDFFTNKVNQALASANRFDQESVWQVFQLLGHRPEALRQLVSQVAINSQASSFSDLLKKDTLERLNQIWQEFENDFNSLPRLHQAILSLLIKQERAWSPFSEESLRYYQEIIQQPKLAISSVQTAIQTLREQGFIWQSSRGVYAFEDESFAEWLTQKIGQ